MNTTHVYVCCSSLYSELDFDLNGAYMLWLHSPAEHCHSILLVLLCAVRNMK